MKNMKTKIIIMLCLCKLKLETLFCRYYVRCWGNVQLKYFARGLHDDSHSFIIVVITFFIFYFFLQCKMFPTCNYAAYTNEITVNSDLLKRKWSRTLLSKHDKRRDINS